MESVIEEGVLAALKSGNDGNLSPACASCTLNVVVPSYTSRTFSFTRSGILVRTFWLAAFLVGSTACSISVEAQASSLVLPVPPGARVRVTAASLVSPLMANYLEMRADTVVLVDDRAGQGLWSIPYSELRSLHLSVGQKKYHAPYMLRGAAVGGGAGFVIGALLASTISPSDTSKKFKRVTTGLVGAGIGAALGTLVGSRFSVENWSPITLPRRLSLVPSAHGAALRVDVLF